MEATFRQCCWNTNLEGVVPVETAFFLDPSGPAWALGGASLELPRLQSQQDRLGDLLRGEANPFQNAEGEGARNGTVHSFFSF